MSCFISQILKFSLSLMEGGIITYVLFRKHRVQFQSHQSSRENVHQNQNISIFT